MFYEGLMTLIRLFPLIYDITVVEFLNLYTLPIGRFEGGLVPKPSEDQSRTLRREVRWVGLISLIAVALFIDALYIWTTIDVYVFFKTTEQAKFILGVLMAVASVIVICVCYHISSSGVCFTYSVLGPLTSMLGRQTGRAVRILVVMAFGSFILAAENLNPTIIWIFELLSRPR